MEEEENVEGAKGIRRRKEEKGRGRKRKEEEEDGRRRDHLDLLQRLLLVSLISILCFTHNIKLSSTFVQNKDQMPHHNFQQK